VATRKAPLLDGELLELVSIATKEVISMRFDQNLRQGENWPTEDII
jgi:hypothetical protein